MPKKQVFFYIISNAILIPLIGLLLALLTTSRPGIVLAVIAGFASSLLSSILWNAVGKTKVDLAAGDSAPATNGDIPFTGFSSPRRLARPSADHAPGTIRRAQARSLVSLHPNRDGVWIWTDGQSVRVIMVLDGKSAEAEGVEGGRWAGPFDLLDMSTNADTERTLEAFRRFHVDATRESYTAPVAAVAVPVVSVR